MPNNRGISAVVNQDFGYSVARGEFTAYSFVNKYGRNVDTDPAASATAVIIGRDIWDGGIAGAVPWVPPTQARVHNLASSNDEDGGAGTDTGALTIRIFGLDSDYLLQQEDLTLNGTTNVATANAYTMIHRMYVLTAGSADRNLGNIKATSITDAKVTAWITINNNQTAMAIYQIPGDKTGYLNKFFSSLQRRQGAAQFADAMLMIKEFGGVWRLQETLALASDGSPHATHNYDYPLVLPAKTYVKMVADPLAVEYDISAGFSLILAPA